MNKTNRSIRIGCGAGFSGDRLEPAVLLAEKGELDYLVLECLAERTIALAQQRKKDDPLTGFDPLLERRIKLLLPHLLKNKICLITNMGAANPLKAAEKIVEIAREGGFMLRVAAVLGDDVLEKIDDNDLSLENSKPLHESGEILSANAYLGAEAILPALKSGADIIITGRVADPSLFVAPIIHEFGWSFDDTEKIGQATVIGHLMECAGQICGGYFAEPGLKEIKSITNLGHPYVDVFQDGTAVISKVKGTGGEITLATAKEQLLYEVTNPFEYITPDVIADFTSVKLEQIQPDEIRVTGGKGKVKPRTLKVSVGYHGGYKGEGEITYAGSNAGARARLAGEILRERLKSEIPDVRFDYIGINSVHASSFLNLQEPYEIRLRIAGRTLGWAQAARIGEEVESLYTNGPAGGGGVRKYVSEILGIVSTLINRDEIKPSFKVFES